MSLSAYLCRPALAGLLWLALIQGLGAAEYEARLAYARPLPLSTPVSGVVSRVEVRPGQIVQQGELLMELDQRLFNARVKRARAQVEKTRQERDEALRELERTQEMFDRTLLSMHDLQVVQVEAASATAAHQSAQAALEEASLKQEYSSLLAPFAARVESVDVQPGQTLVHRFQAAPLVTLVPIAYQRALARLDIDQAYALQPGQAASVIVNGEVFPGEVDAVIPLPRAETKAGMSDYQVEVRFTAGPSFRQADRAALIRMGE